MNVDADLLVRDKHGNLVISPAFAYQFDPHINVWAMSKQQQIAFIKKHLKDDPKTVEKIKEHLEADGIDWSDVEEAKDIAIKHGFYNERLEAHRN